MGFRASKIQIRYIQSETLEVQGEYNKDIFPYIQKGYDITRKFKDTWILTKRAKPYVKMICESDDDQEEDRVFMINMKFQILQYYGRDRISQKLLEQFEKDFNSEKFELCTEDGLDVKIIAKQ